MLRFFPWTSCRTILMLPSTEESLGRLRQTTKPPRINPRKNTDEFNFLSATTCMFAPFYPTSYTLGSGRSSEGLNGLKFEDDSFDFLGYTDVFIVWSCTSSLTACHWSTGHGILRPLAHVSRDLSVGIAPLHFTRHSNHSACLCAKGDALL